MADESRMPKVDRILSQADSDKYFVSKAEKTRARLGTKVIALKGRNKIIGALLAGGVLGIYGYTMFSVRQGRLLEEFDKVPE